MGHFCRCKTRADFVHVGKASGATLGQASRDLWMNMLGMTGTAAAEARSMWRPSQVQQDNQTTGAGAASSKGLCILGVQLEQSTTR